MKQLFCILSSHTPHLPWPLDEKAFPATSAKSSTNVKACLDQAVPALRICAEVGTKRVKRFGGLKLTPNFINPQRYSKLDVVIWRLFDVVARGHRTALST